jgi:hypothetical protein
LTQIIAERPTFWETAELVDGGESAGPLDRKINQWVAFTAKITLLSASAG